MGQWLRLNTSNVGSSGSIPSQGTGSHMPQLRSKIPCATAKNQHSQTKKYICKERKKKLGGKNNYEGKLNLNRKIILTYIVSFIYYLGFPGGSLSKESACNAGDLPVLQCRQDSCIAGDPGSIPGSGRNPRGGNGNLLQYSCLENSMDRGAWQATVHGVIRVRHSD